VIALGRLAITALCLALIAVAWPASPAPAAFPGVNGQIAFFSNRDAPGTVKFEVYTMNADGSGQVNRTVNAAEDSQPVWSADGTRIAFESERDGNREIYTMNADGTGQVRRTVNAAQDTQPAWSPDGTKIAFESSRDTSDEIYTMNADGTGQVNRTVNAAPDRDPAWSPDGTKIAFVSVRPGDDFDEIYTMNADGTGQVNVTANTTGADTHPAWSPDGTKIAFASDRDGFFEIYTMNADGTNQTRLTTNTAVDSEPAWSPDGTKIAFESNRDGNFEIYTMNADGTGQARLTTNTAVDQDPDWQPLGGCPPIRVGFAVAQGCFTETAPGSGIFETEEKAWVGGFEIQPRFGGKLVLNTNTKDVSESGEGVDVIFAGFRVPLPVTTLPVDLESGSVEINQGGSIEKVVLDLPVEGQASVSWEEGGTQAKFEAEIEIEKLAAPVGALVSTSSLTEVGESGGSLEASLVNGQGFVLDAAEVKVNEISVIPSSLKIPRTLTLKNLLLKFELKDGKPFWTGQAGIKLPLTRGTLDVTGRAFIFDRFPAGAGLAVDNINRRIAATPIFLQSASGDLVFAPDFGFDLTVGGSLGPRVNGKELVKLTGQMQAGPPAQGDCPGDDPSKLTLSSELTPLEPFEAAGLAEAIMEGRACIFPGTSPAIELRAEVAIAFLNEALAYEASQAGLVSTRGANLEGAATLKLPGLPDPTGQAIISTKGTAACGQITPFLNAGFGHRWGAATPPSAFSGCDLGPFRVAVSSRAKRGGAGAITVPAGLPHAGFAATGATGPPAVTLSGPGNPEPFVVEVAPEKTTYLFVNDPKPGDYGITANDPANPLTSVRLSEGLDEPKVKGRVKGAKKRFTLNYDLREIDGQRVTFYEAGEGIYEKLGTAKGADGTLSFDPVLATNRKRTIEAEVTQNGLPRVLLTIAKFKAPKLPKLKAPKVKAKRTKKSLKLSWAKVAGADTYLVEVKAGAEVLYRVVSKRTRLRFSDTPKQGKLKVSVQALSEIQPPGPAAKLKVKPKG
jgi:Tol biopolymer transport system component